MTAEAPAAPGALPAGLAEGLSATALRLARRFAAGATMWCVSPTWPHHARHVAVEFVHPVGVGARALPALLVPPGDLVATLRVSVRPGDVVLAVAPGDETSVAEALRRGDAWGVDTVWLGTGPRPASGAADAVLWLPDEPQAPYDGRFLLLYHVLWELTSVCLDFPGLLREPPVSEAGVCTTCSDEGRLTEVVTAEGPTALVLADGRRETVDTTLVGAVGPGDLLLVHAGSAITRLSP